ncbi:MAG: class I SAM-dependent methyltransferase [ANME-2 cluster archaeon]|nr:class I SAM-dependent methyltransferase [ANME-2 cluster archaeon]
MPYATFDRDEFTARTGLGPDMQVLNIGPDHITPIQIARNVETTVITAISNPGYARGLLAASDDEISPVVSEYSHLPFKSASFDIIFSYHALNNIPPQDVPDVLVEAGRLLNDNCRIASLVWSLKPTNNAQSSHMMLLEILAQLGIIHLHSFGDISRWLEAAGFDEITMELVTNHIPVPEGWVHSHITRLDQIISKRAGDLDLPDISDALESYHKHAKEYGEEMLPSIQFMARHSAGLSGIDIVL